MVVPTFADRGYRVVSATDPFYHILGFLDRNSAKHYCGKHDLRIFVSRCLIAVLINACQGPRLVTTLYRQADSFRSSKSLYD
jgi:hypothetical protein